MSEKLVALVTGANKGVGKQVAKELVARGFIVFVGSRGLANGETAAHEIGDGAIALQLDITDARSIAAATARIEAEAGRLDVLVNNAGVGQSGRYASADEVAAAGVPSKASLDEMRAVFETNVFGTLAVTQAMLPLIRSSSSGRIVNVSSGVGSLTLNSDPSFPFRPYFGVTYGASKTALNAVTVALAIELESSGVKVRAASPGYTATAMNDFKGTDTVEVGSRPVVAAVLDTESPTGNFLGPQGPFPW